MSSPKLRRFRAASLASQASQTSPRLIPGSFASVDATSNATEDVSYGSLRGTSDTHHSAISPSVASGHREPTRSYVHLPYRGALVPVDAAHYAKSVREDTAELASYALSDKASIRSSSPSRRSAQTHLESYFQHPMDGESASNRSEGLRNHIIEEVSEPVSPEEDPIDRSPGTSVLTGLLRRSLSRSPPDSEDEEDDDGSHGEEEGEFDSRQGRLIITSNGIKLDATERTPLVRKGGSVETHHPDWIHAQRDIEAQEVRQKISWSKLQQAMLWPKEKGYDIAKVVSNPSTWDRSAMWENAVLAPAAAMPAVILGLLLNILDALSYGMILFPHGQPIFEKLGSAGISMFYISCIVSQVIYSGGGSVFKGGIGSEMIEVVPFFHKMAFTILARVGEENADAVIATTITSYALSSVLTGIVFFIMGASGFGYIVGFIPRHILIGCIGGVGYFLIATGVEVSARLDGNLNYNRTTLSKLFEADTVCLWVVPLALAILLSWSDGVVKSKYYLPVFILCIPAVFYFFVFSLDQLDPQNLRESGWIFQGPEAGEPWWFFYTLYSASHINPLSSTPDFSRIRSRPLGCGCGDNSSYVCVDIFRSSSCPN